MKISIIILIFVSLGLGFKVESSNSLRKICLLHGSIYANVGINQSCPVALHDKHGNLITPTIPIPNDHETHESNPDCYSHFYENLFD